ncbi:uncharacterized protein LOC113865694 isoform X2 [Abrus precatorius]|nr:uncharacterized protein LOC113865694 isoform X2 [Abrus precatorius]
MRTSVEGGKRQLPPWMMQKVGASHGSDSENVVKTNTSVGKGANATKKDRKRESSRRKSNLKAKCETKGRKKLDQQDGSSDDNTQKKRKKGDRCGDRVQRSAIKNGKNLEDPSHGSSDVYPVEGSNDEAVELTVDDLIAIAEEYVKDYENKERVETSGGQCESKWEFQVTNETGTSLDSPCENKISSSCGREGLTNSTSTTGKLIATSTSQSGHPAQDMLDLFLGPLLRKTLEKEEESKSVVKNLQITHEFPRQSQDESAREEVVPLMKKKNTLKDKVAMFLDQDM